MHLQLNQRLQEVASYKRDKYKPEELDMALNKAMFRLLEQGVDSKFEDDQINLSHASGLIQKRKVADIIIPQSNDPLYEENVLTGYTVIPPDFYWLINNRLEVLTDPINCSIAPALPITTTTEYVAVVAFPALDSIPYFDNVTVASSVTGTLYTSPTQIAAGFNSPNSQYVVVHNILETLYRKYSYLSVYWERYRDTYYKNSFILVGTSPIGTITITSGGNTSTGVASSNTYTIFNRGLIPNLASKTVQVTSSKVAEGNELYNVLKQNVFYQTRAIEPIIDQTLDYLIYYRDVSFIITRSYMDYIRKPRTISLLLNQSCELGEATHPKIVDLAVEVLRLDTKDPAYPATTQDIQLRTN